MILWDAGSWERAKVIGISGRRDSDRAPHLHWERRHDQTGAAAGTLEAQGYVPDPTGQAWNLNGVGWMDAPAPRRRHAHWAQTIGVTTVEMHRIERCPCSAMRVDGWRWMRETTPRVAPTWGALTLSAIADGFDKIIRRHAR